MLHLPAANGPSPRSVHRSKWFGASMNGRKFLEALVCRTNSGAFLSRAFQTRFVTDGVIAERTYDIDLQVCERYFVPDRIAGLIWSQHGQADLTIEPYLLMRYIRAGSPEYAYHAEIDGGLVVVSRELATQSDIDMEEVDTGGTPEVIHETLWAACRVDGGEINVRENHPDRWRPMWYSMDAARRRYLRRLAVRDTRIVEHAPLWELASDWTYSPVTIHSRDNCVITLGFGTSREEAVCAATVCLEASSELEAEKRRALSSLLRDAWFSTGHAATDRAYGHVLSRVVDCLVVNTAGTDAQPDSAGMVAGNAYFQEAWTRDENISVGGLLATGQYRLARAIVDATWRQQDLETGRLPLRWRAGEQPGYTSSDGSLWALVRLAQYTTLTGDRSLLEAKWPMVAVFFRQSLAACREGLLPSGGIAVKGHEWETWMDTEFSARAGFPIEIQLLWLATLESYSSIVQHGYPKLSAAMAAGADQLRRSLDLFRIRDHFADHLTRDLDAVDLLTPNSYFWTILGLEFDWDWEADSLAVGRRELAGMSGIRTLARSQWESVLGPQITALARSDRPLPSIGKANYHRGVEWNWLAQLFVAGELRHGNPEAAFDAYLSRQVTDATAIAGLGGISEVYDHRGPAGPDFQTWSMCGLVEALHRFLGVTVDVPAGRIAIRPLKPRRWPHLRARKWFGDVAFDVEYSIRGATESLAVTFQEPPPRPLTLTIELLVGSDRGAGSVRLEKERQSLDVSEMITIHEQPRRLSLTTEAGAVNRLTVRSDRTGMPPD
ncbi:MAG TPA: amylo-alpha-1,6-glucosidase [Chloroflexota bacterium]|jgi:glycogen debranching enzyme|nr:amylo-alpha-1,6-glucosidase [Chloroflexota bacterium]